MLRLHDGQATLWEQMLPDEIQLMGPELEAVDSLLDDPRFLAPFVERFACPIGRPTIPMDSYLRLMYLKHRHGLGYETLCKEVADSLSWRRFCRIALHKDPPHPTTLMTCSVMLSVVACRIGRATTLSGRPRPGASTATSTATQRRVRLAAGRADARGHGNAQPWESSCLPHSSRPVCSSRCATCSWVHGMRRSGHSPA